MEKRYLYVVLTRTDTILSRLIRAVKKDDYTHASISLDKELNSMYSFGRKYVYNPFIGRFKQEKINDGLYKLKKVVPCILLEIEVTQQQYENARQLLNHFLSNRELYKYNYMGLLHSLFNIGTCHENRFLCSEFVYYILKEIGIVDLKMPRNLVRPQNLLVLESNVIYVGNLKQLNYHKSNNTTKDLQMGELRTIYGYS